MSSISSGVTMQFFVVIKDQNTALDLQKLDIEADFQKEISRIFVAQAEEFLGPNIKKIPFHVMYKPSIDSISFIQPFDLPAHLKRGMNNPQEFDRMSLAPGGPTIKAILAIDNGSISGKPAYYFQHFDKSHVLQTGLFAMLRGGIFSGLTEPGIRIAEKLTAAIVGDSLLFRSYGRTSQFIDLASIYQEATDEAIEKTLQHEKFFKTDHNHIISICTVSMKKMFSAIAFTKILEHPDVSPDKIQRGVKKFFDFKVEIKEDKTTGKRLLVFPIDRIEAGRLLEYLTESVYQSDLTGDMWTSNSHRPLKVD